MTAANRVVLHEYKTTFLLVMIPLFFAIGCLITAVSFGLPRLLVNPNAPSVPGPIILGWLAGLGMPLLAIGLWLFVPAITTSYDPGRRVVVVEKRRPLGRSAAEYRVEDIAEFRPVGVGRRGYALHLILKTKQSVPLEHSSTSNVDRVRAEAAQMAQTIGLTPAPRAVRL